MSLLEAGPFACAAYARDDGTLVAANRRFDDEFAALPEHGPREQMLARLLDGALDDAESRSDERHGGDECVRTCSSTSSRYTETINICTTLRTCTHTYYIQSSQELTTT